MFFKKVLAYKKNIVPEKKYQLLLNESIPAHYGLIKRTFTSPADEKYFWIETDESRYLEIKHKYKALAVNSGNKLSKYFEQKLSDLEDMNSASIKEALQKFTNIWSIVFLTTTRCNQKCEICLRFIDHEKPLDLKEFKQVIDVLYRYDVKRISFSGGEPTLIPLQKQLIEMIKYARSLGLTTVLTTNGTLLTKDLVGKLDGYLDEVIIPYDGSTEDVFKASATYGDTQHISKLEDVFSYIMHSSTITLKVDTVLSKVNKADIFNIGSRLKQLGVKTWKISFYYTTDTNSDVKDKYTLSMDEFHDVEKQLKITFSKDLNLFFLTGEQYTFNNVFMISPSGDYVQNRLSQHCIIGNIRETPSLLAHEEYFSITPPENYRIAGQEKYRNFRPNQTYWQYFQSRHFDRMTYLSRYGSQIYNPHIDYGANILIPDYVRSMVFSQLDTFTSLMGSDICFIDPVLYSIGLGAIQKHLTDSNVYELENIWKQHRPSELFVVGPYVGKAALYYALIPKDDPWYFKNLREKIKSVFNSELSEDKLLDIGVGWFNVAWFNKSISPHCLDALTMAFQDVNATPLISFNPVNMGPMKSNWIDSVYDFGSILLDYKMCASR